MTPLTASSRFPRASATLAVGLACAALVLLALPRDVAHQVRTTRGGIQRLDADALHEHGTEGQPSPLFISGSDTLVTAVAAPDDGAGASSGALALAAWRPGPPGHQPAAPFRPSSVPSPFDRPLSPSAGRAPPLS